MGTGYLIDSNTVIDFLNGSLPDKAKYLLINNPPLISVITQIEIFSSNKISSTELLKLNDFIKIATVYNVDYLVAMQTIKLRLKYKIKLPDAVIGATALKHNLKLITRNVSDFKNIEGLTLINPYSK